MSDTQTVLKPIQTDKDSYQFLEPVDDDGAKMWELVRDSGVLDINSPYSYLMMGKYFKETSVVAKRNGKLVGFVTAFIPPEKQDVIFVWQIGVAKSEQGKGLASRILQELVNRDACKKVRYLEATISPSNVPSQSLFRGFAKKVNTECEVFECFSEDVFPPEGEHEAELTHRIGPFR